MLTMAIDPRKRQKQLEKKAAKRKAVQSARKTAQAGGAGSPSKQLAVVKNFPIHECLVPEGLFEIGIGNVIFSRKLPNGDIGTSFFLVDVYCLGVKNAFFQVMTGTEYLSNVRKFAGTEKLESVAPSCARKLVENAEADAKQIGFDPHPDYRSARKIFGDIDASVCATDFTFGKDGKPFFMPGLNDTPAECRNIIDTLSRRFGPDGFHFLWAGAEEPACLGPLTSTLEGQFGKDPQKSLLGE
jgi:hypothetical protein